MSERASSVPRNPERLAERRRRQRKRLRIAFGIFCIALIALFIYGLNQSSVRVARIEIFGTSAELEPLVRGALSGRYAFIIPRDSIIFLPKTDIRERILSSYPSFAAVSIFRSGLTSISVRVTPRTAVARWCGDAYAPTPAHASTTERATESSCYFFDTNGFAFATSTEGAPLNDMRLYESFGALQSPVPRDHILPNADAMPNVFKMARELSTMGAIITDIYIHDGQVDLYADDGTRIMYMLGKETAAFTALNSTRDSVELGSGAIEYVDLRFDAKLYVKRKGASVNRHANASATP